MACGVRAIRPLDTVHENFEIVGTFFRLQSAHALTFVQQNVLVDADGNVGISGLGETSNPSTVSGVNVVRFSRGAILGLNDPQCSGFDDTESAKESDTHAFRYHCGGEWGACQFPRTKPQT